MSSTHRGVGVRWQRWDPIGQRWLVGRSGAGGFQRRNVRAEANDPEPHTLAEIDNGNTLVMLDDIQDTQWLD